MSDLVPAWQAEFEAEDRHTGPSLRRLILASAAIIVFGFGGFFTWACVARLDSAVPALGQIAVESKRKTVTLLDPGILQEIYVGEGDTVVAGQRLLRLDQTQAESALMSLKVQLWTARARIARLRAEQSGASGPVFPDDVLAAAAADPGVAALVENERRVFADRKTAYEGTIAVQRKEIGQLQDQIAALEAQGRSAREQLAVIERERGPIEELAAQGLALRSRVYELRRNAAAMRGAIGDVEAKQAEAGKEISQTELEIVQTTNERNQDISNDLQDAQASAADLTEKVRAGEDLLARRVVTAPQAGTVTDLKLFTPGSAMPSGQPILDIVPADDRLLLEVNVRPDDIEHVKAGQRVNIRMTSYKQHQVPVLTGRLVYVSADRQQDPKGEYFFLARAEIDPDSLSRAKAVALRPGMPVEVLILGGERRAIDYFISPITDSLRRSLREE
jgi:HlyD family secretion protein